MPLRWNLHSVVQLYQKNPILFITRVVIGLVVVGLIYTLFQAVIHWRTLSDIEALPTSPALTTSPEAPESSLATEEAVDAKQISEWHLFGRPGASQFGQDLDPSEIPITSLQLKLKGVMSINGKGSAIISDKERVDKFYVVGATLPGPAILRAVYPDRILLEYRARLETLWIEAPENAKAGSDARPGSFLEDDEDEEEFFDEEFEEFEEDGEEEE